MHSNYCDCSSPKTQDFKGPDAKLVLNSCWLKTHCLKFHFSALVMQPYVNIYMNILCVLFFNLHIIVKFNLQLQVKKHSRSIKEDNSKD